MDILSLSSTESQSVESFRESIGEQPCYRLPKKHVCGITPRHLTRMLTWFALGKCYSSPSARWIMRCCFSGATSRVIARKRAPYSRRVLDTQFFEPPWDYGRFPMLLPEDSRDLNAVLFLAPHLAEIHTHWLPVLPEALAERFRRAIAAAAVAVVRRWDDELFDVPRDYKAYSNIFILYILAPLLFARCLESSACAAMGWRSGSAGSIISRLTASTSSAPLLITWLSMTECSTSWRRRAIRACARK